MIVEPHDEIEISTHNHYQDVNVLKFLPYSEKLGDFTSKEVFEVNQNGQLTHDNTPNSIDEDLDSIFRPRRNRWNILANRRDVINKSILRGFKRFFVKLLNIKDNDNLSTPSKFKQNCQKEIINRARKLGILELAPDDSSYDSFEELIIFLGYAKITKQVRKMFNADNSAIHLIEDVLTNYSHQKLNKMFKNKEIKVLFKYFIEHDKERFIEGTKLNSEININSDINK